MSGYPLIQLVYQSLFTAGRLDLRPYSRLWQGQTGIALEHTFIVSAAATAAAAAFGTAAALLTLRSDLPGRRAIGLLLLLPLLTPPFVQSVSWLRAYARGGLVWHWWGVSAEWLRGPLGVIVLLALEAYPLVYLLAGAQLASQREAELEEAARAAGAGQWRTLLDVTLPRLSPVLLAGILIAFISSASDFGVPAVLAIPAGYTVVTTLIYRQLSFAGPAGALAEVVALSALLALIATGALLAAARLSRADDAGPRTARGGGLATLHLGHWRWPVAALLAVGIAGATALPLLALFLQSVAPGFVPVLAPAAWSVDHFRAALDHGGLQALADSAVLAAAAAAVIAAGGWAVASATRRAGPTARAIVGLTALPFALPGSVVAVACLLAWQRWLYGTFVIIFLAYLARFAIFGVRAAGAALAGLPPELTQAARSSGARPWRAALDVERPLVQPAALAGLALVFLLAVHELTISSLLYTPRTVTLAVQVLNAQQAGDVSVTAALAVIVMAVTVAAALPLALSARIRRLLGVDLVA